MPDNKLVDDDLELITEITKEAGAIALNWFGKDPQVWMKEGQSPVSEADFAVDRFLKEKLLSARPDYGWLSEETDDDQQRLNTKRTFVVDPIDGTRGFINGMKRWCVSVAVVENNRPVAGILECPALKETITASAGCGAMVNGRSVTCRSVRPNDKVRISGPRSLETVAMDATSLPLERTPFIPSLAYRIAMVATGQVDLTLARASAKDWDVAAADLIALESGASLTDLFGNALTYNCKDLRHGALVASHVDRHSEMLDLAALAIKKMP